MAKKTIINDFGSLKGKISFSEKNPDAAWESQEVRTNARNADIHEEEGLKIGNDVVLMDSSLRGKIVALGKKVRIELEDGLEIEAAYGEFAVTAADEIHSLKGTGIKRKTEPKSLGKKPTKATCKLTIDLHIEAISGGRSIPKGQQLQFQLDTFRRVVRANLRHKGMKIIFIHGIGDGILKAAIRKELDEVLSLRCSYSTGDPALTTVTIK